MAGWAGFSEEELMRMKLHKDSSDSHRRTPSTNKSRQQLQREKALKQQIQKVQDEDGRGLIPQEQQLSKLPKSKPSPTQPTPVAGPKSPDAHTAKASLGVRQGHVETQIDKKEDPNPTSTAKEMQRQDKSRLDQLQLEQRLMEEKNKRKKALLAKTIAERSKKTHAETVKLKRIQKELQALDDMVSTEIGILRNRIDQACLDFSYAKRRFDKAEAEYIASKLDFHKKTEIKEQLAEHLCTIIQQNELRKAKKLEELMQQLEVETDEEKLELEIEVEQMLLQQENEAKREALQVNVTATPLVNVTATPLVNVTTTPLVNVTTTPQVNITTPPPAKETSTPPVDETAIPPVSSGLCALPTEQEKKSNNLAAVTQAAGKPLHTSLDNTNNDQTGQVKA